MARRRSLNKDGNDWRKIRHNRDQYMGFSISEEYYQTVPLFFSREAMSLPLIGHYKGGSIFIICNGPSLVSGKYDLNKLKLPGVMTYGMNNGAKTIRPNFWSCVDDPKRFIKSIWLDPCITKFIPLDHAEKKIFDNDNEKWQEFNTMVGECPNVIFFRRNEKFMPDRFLFEDTLNWGNHSDNGGGRSIMLPVLRICFLLGFRTIYLMGADFKMSQTYTYHFDEQREKGAVNCNNSTYDRLKNEYFPALKPYLEEEGVKVYNCNPDSALTTFDYMSFDDAIQNTIDPLGDIANERTWGMYSKPDEKAKWKVEPDNSRKAHLTNIKNRPVTPVFDGGVISIPHFGEQDSPLNIPVAPVMHPEPKLYQPPRLPQNPHKEIQNIPRLRHVRDVAAQTGFKPMPEIESPPIVPMFPVHQNEQNHLTPSRKIIRNVPCGAICDGSSNNDDKGNVTIKDDGN